MARKPATIDVDAIHAASEGYDPALAEGMANLQSAAALHTQEISQQWGDGLPYERQRVINEASFFKQVGEQAVLEFGRRLVLIKENEPHGEYLKIVDSTFKISPDTAERLMRVAVKHDRNGLEGKTATLRLLGMDRSKVWELFALDDEPLKELAEGGTVAGLTLDEIERMGTRELRSALREARENEQAQGRVMADKDAKINELATKLTKTERRKAAEIAQATPDDQLKALCAEATQRAYNAEHEVRGNLRLAIEAITHHTTTHGGNQTEMMSGLLAQVERAVREVRDLYGLKDRPDGEDRPAWLDGAEEELERMGS